MIKKLLIVIFATFLFAFGLFANPSFDIGPFAGFAGIPIGNNYFKGGVDWLQP